MRFFNLTIKLYMFQINLVVFYKLQNWSAPLPPSPVQQFPWSNGNNFVPPLPTVPPPPPPPPGS